MPENDVRDKISQDFANQAGQYDVATLSNYEIPVYAYIVHAGGPRILDDLSKFLQVDPHAFRFSRST
ncbi:hypothetical protein ACWCQR_05830, partial [Streptomyces sp. NPDC002172]